jgi:hypothetical protein
MVKIFILNHKSTENTEVQAGKSFSVVIVEFRFCLFGSGFAGLGNCLFLPTPR